MIAHMTDDELKDFNSAIHDFLTARRDLPPPPLNPSRRKGLEETTAERQIRLARSRVDEVSSEYTVKEEEPEP